VKYHFDKVLQETRERLSWNARRQLPVVKHSHSKLLKIAPEILRAIRDRDTVSIAIRVSARIFYAGANEPQFSAGQLVAQKTGALNVDFFATASEAWQAG